MRELLEARAELTAHTSQPHVVISPLIATGAVSRKRKGRQVQDRSDRIQDRTQDKSDRTQDRSDRAQGRSGYVQEQRPDERVGRAWGISSQGDNRDHSRTDFLNSLDHPFQRYKSAWDLRRARPEEICKVWSDRAEPSRPQPCGLCPDQEFNTRGDLLAHVDAVHGGTQRYRNAYLTLRSLSPCVVKGQEWRAVLGNYSEFFARSALDWERLTPDMESLLWTSEGLPADRRWEPRSRQACVFCCRLLWREELFSVFLAGDECFMASPSRVADLLSWERYHQHWPDIPQAELKASAVNLRIGATDEYRLVLLHRRRVSEAQARGDEEVHICDDCHVAFKAPRPSLCKYALANQLWLGRWDPLFRNANLSHQMLLALARVVTTKVVLRPQGRAVSKSDATPSWDFLFHQSGMIGSAILFGNASCTKAWVPYLVASIVLAPAVNITQLDGNGYSRPNNCTI